MVYSVAGATIGTTVDAEVLSDDNDIDPEIDINVELLKKLVNTVGKRIEFRY